MNSRKFKEQDFSLNKLRAGDRAEFARLVESYSGLVYRLALKMLENSQDAEDVLQETFVKAYNNLPNFDGRSSLSTWLYRIATNESLMHLRHRKQKIISIDETLEKSTEYDQKPVQITDWCCLPEKELMSAEAITYMQEAVELLPTNLKIVFLLRDIEGLSTRETAEVLDLTETNVKTRLSRARLRLRNMLSSYHNEKVIDRMG